MLLAIEGLDGSGKTTQTRCLLEDLKEKIFAIPAAQPPWAQNYAKVQSICFPQYCDSICGQYIIELQDDKPDEITADYLFLTSLLYALDRFEYSQLLTGSAEYAPNENILICDRYVPSNIAYQCAYLSDKKEQDALRQRIERIEYRLLQIPQPQLTIYLDIPVEHAIRRCRARKIIEIPYGMQADSDNLEYLHRVRMIYCELAQTRWHWYRVNCFEGPKERTVNEIRAEIWEIVQNELDKY